MKRFLTTVLTVILTIVLLAGAAAGFILYRKYKPSKEQVDQNEWYQASGDEMALVIGLKYYGLYVLKSYEITHRQLHYGVTLSAEVQLALQEYN